MGELESFMAEKHNALFTFESFHSQLKALKPMLGVRVGRLITVKVGLLLYRVLYGIGNAMFFSAPGDTPFIYIGASIYLALNLEILENGNAVEIFLFDEVRQ